MGYLLLIIRQFFKYLFIQLWNELYRSKFFKPKLLQYRKSLKPAYTILA